MILQVAPLTKSLEDVEHGIGTFRPMALALIEHSNGHRTVEVLYAPLAPDDTLLLGSLLTGSELPDWPRTQEAQFRSLEQVS